MNPILKADPKLLTGLLYIKLKGNVSVMAGRASQPKEVFNSHYGRLQQAIIASVPLAANLLAKRLIGTATNTKVITTDGVPSDTKAAWILVDVRATLETSNHPDTVLRTFCDVLDDSGEPALGGIAASMRSFLDGEIIRRPIFFLR